MSNGDSEYKEEVRRAVYRALAVGKTTLEEIIVAVGSPDPRLLKDSSKWNISYELLEKSGGKIAFSTKFPRIPRK